MNRTIYTNFRESLLTLNAVITSAINMIEANPHNEDRREEVFDRFLQRLLNAPETIGKAWISTAIYHAEVDAYKASLREEERAVRTALAAEEEKAAAAREAAFLAAFRKALCRAVESLPKQYQAVGEETSKVIWRLASEGGTVRDVANTPTARGTDYERLAKRAQRLKLRALSHMKFPTNEDRAYAEARIYNL